MAQKRVSGGAAHHSDFGGRFQRFGSTGEYATNAYPDHPPKPPIKGLTRIRTKGAAMATAASTARQSTAKMMLFLQDMAPLISLAAAVTLGVYAVNEQRLAALTLSEGAHPLAKR